MTFEEKCKKLHDLAHKLLYITQCGEYLTFPQMQIVQGIFHQLASISNDDRKFKITKEGLEELIEEHVKIANKGDYNLPRTVRFH